MADKKTTQTPQNMPFERLRVEEDEYLTHLSVKYKTRKPYRPKNPFEITAFIPGTVDVILVKKGEKVSKGQMLMVLHAMKMNNELLAPADATVKAVLVKPGDHVVKDQIMIELK